jgi:hypothetical protein
MVQVQSKITVIDPRGWAPTLRQEPMAPRLNSLDGKTVYVVDVNWPYTHQFTEELYKVFSKRYPNTKFVFSDKAGSYFDDDAELWAEIKEKGDAMILGVGH